jgi:CHASE2 domain-containing sensor protein
MKNWLRKLYDPHSILVTVLIFAFIYLFRFLFLNMHALDPFNYGIKDYEITDIVYSQLHDPSDEGVQQDIILLNSGSEVNRNRLAKTLQQLQELEPAVVGIDILFDQIRDTRQDSFLNETLRSFPNIVLAAELPLYDQQKKQFDSLTNCHPYFCGGQQLGFTNFVSEETSTIRLFAPLQATTKGLEKAFSVQVAEAYAPERVAQLLQRGGKVERINYTGSSTFGNFYKYSYDQLLDSVLFEQIKANARFKDKIVLVGFVGNHQPGEPDLDRLFTPLNQRYAGKTLPDMYGMEIHANIINMILDGNYIFEFPLWLLEVLAWLYCYANVLLIRRIYEKIPDQFHGITRLLQIAEFLIIFFLIAFLFYFFRIQLDFASGILALVLAYDFVMIYESFIRKRIKYLQNL